MKLLLSLVFALFFAAGTAIAQENGPDVLVKKVTDDVLTYINLPVEADNKRSG